MTDVSYEQLSYSVLVQITDDLWMNPTHIVAAYRNGDMTSLASVSGATEVIDRPLEEVVAILNGEA